MKIRVEPYDALFDEMGNNTYDFNEVLSELIDNSLAARYDDNTLNINIEIILDALGKPKTITINDDAKGIPLDDLGRAISPAGIQHQNSLNEHGLGMKQAVASLGHLVKLATKTKDNPCYMVERFAFGDIEVHPCDLVSDSGTRIVIDNLKPIVFETPQAITKKLVPVLGARYRRFLKPDGKVMNLNVKMEKEGDPSFKKEWEVKEIKPVYFHPSTRMNEPVISRMPISGDGWRANLTFGYAAMKEEGHFEELGMDSIPEYHPYNVSLKKQGLDIILNGRVIMAHQLSELEIVQKPHPSFNHIRGEIDLIEGFKTATTKNSIIKDDHFNKCIETVRNILSGDADDHRGKRKNYLKSKTYSEELPEALLRDRLVGWLKDNPLQKRDVAEKEYSISALDGFIDIYAKIDDIPEAWELKTQQASSLDVYQLFMYMDVEDIQNGHLVAPSFSPGASNAVRLITEKHKKIISLDKTDGLPINHSPTSDELSKYY